MLIIAKKERPCRGDFFGMMIMVFTVLFAFAMAAVLSLAVLSLMRL